MKKIFAILFAAALFAPLASAKNDLLIDAVRPIIYSDWDEVENFENAREVEWFAIHFKVRMLILYHQNATEEETRMHFKVGCSDKTDPRLRAYGKCYPYSKNTRIFEIEAQDSDEILGYVITWTMADFPKVNGEDNAGPEISFRMIYYEDGTKAQGPAYF